MIQLLVIALLLASAGSSAANTELDAAFETDVLTVVANQHACYRFDIYLAISREQQLRGLMHVRNLPATTGMLFVYNDNNVHSMWMKNTYISLDIAFARADGTIANVARHTEPLSLASIRSNGAVQYVLELNAGVSELLAIDAGSRIIWAPALLQQSL